MSAEKACDLRGLRDPRRAMNTTAKSYSLKSDGGKIAAALVKLCTPGQVGESMLRTGVNQSSFGLFLAKLAKAHIEKGRTAEQLADVFALVSGGNASAAKQALNDCEITFEGEKPISVGAYWNRNGDAKGAPNLGLLDL